jgi:hypothetical protein
MPHIKAHMELMYRTEWNHEINDSGKHPKLRLYKETKQEFSPEYYLFLNIPKYRYAISRLRLSSHHLPIETGRHSRPITPSHLRFCQHCPGKLGDEIHFVTECVKYTDLRCVLYSHAQDLIAEFNSMCNREKYISLIACDDMDVLIALGKFVYSAWK